MNTARHFHRAATLFALLLVAGSAAAQSGPPSSLEDPAAESRWMLAGSYVASDQPRLLGEALGRYRDIQGEGGWGVVPTDLVMGPGSSYDCRRIAALEWRLVAEGYLAAPSTPRPEPSRLRKAGDEAELKQWGPCEYTPALNAALREFQIDRKVVGVGQLGRQTMVELNRPVEEIVDILERDLERWRGVSLDASGDYLLVNIPFFDLGVFENDRESLRMAVVVGQPTWQTPLFSDELEYIIVNPDWGIPDRIAKEEYLPSARRDPKWLSRQGIEKTGGSLRQKPGPNNPLGRIKFVMPNEHDVYLHDTPAKGAFKAKARSLSHGCIRLSRPMDLANVLLRGDPEWDSRRLQAGIASGKTLHVNLHRHMPVHVVYSTSRVSPEGRLELRPDVYGKNRVAGQL